MTGHGCAAHRRLLKPPAARALRVQLCVEVSCTHLLDCNPAGPVPRQASWSPAGRAAATTAVAQLRLPGSAAPGRRRRAAGTTDSAPARTGPHAAGAGDRMTSAGRGAAAPTACSGRGPAVWLHTISAWTPLLPSSGPSRYALAASARAGGARPYAGQNCCLVAAEPGARGGAVARPGRRQTGARRTASPTAATRRAPEDVISMLARAVREVEAAVERRRVTPAVRTKFQVVALLVREEHARVRGGRTSSQAHRAEQLKRLDGIATILAKTAVRDPGLLALLAEDAVVSDAAKSLQARDAADGRHRTGARGGRADRSRGRIRRRRAPGRAAVGRLPAAGQPVPRPRLLRRPAERRRPAPAGRLGAAQPAAHARSNGPTSGAPACMALPAPAAAARAGRPAS